MNAVIPNKHVLIPDSAWNAKFVLPDQRVEFKFNGNLTSTELLIAMALIESIIHFRINFPEEETVTYNISESVSKYADLFNLEGTINIKTILDCITGLSVKVDSQANDKHKNNSTRIEGVGSFLCCGATTYKDDNGCLCAEFRLTKDKKYWKDNISVIEMQERILEEMHNEPNG